MNIIQKQLPKYWRKITCNFLRLKIPLKRYNLKNENSFICLFTEIYFLVYKKYAAEEESPYFYLTSARKLKTRVKNIMSCNFAKSLS